MTHLKKKNYQFVIGAKDASVVGRLGGGYPVPAIDWMQDLYGVGLTGVGNYGGSDIDSTSNQGTDNDGTDSGAAATGDAAGGAAAGSGSV